MGQWKNFRRKIRKPSELNTKLIYIPQYINVVNSVLRGKYTEIKAYIRN